MGKRHGKAAILVLAVLLIMIAVAASAQLFADGPLQVSVGVQREYPLDLSYRRGCTDEQRMLLEKLPVSELPKQAVSLAHIGRGDYWRDTLLPLASDGEADVTLYGVVSSESFEHWFEGKHLETDGLVLRSASRCAYYPLAWGGNQEAGSNPWLEVSDFDGDGVGEAAVCVYEGGGTGVSVSCLYFFDLDTMDYHTVDPSTLEIQVNYSPLTHRVKLQAEGLSAVAEVPEAFRPLREVSCGSVVRYEMREEGIVCTLGLNNGTGMYYLAEAEAPVLWDGMNYVLGPLTELDAYE